MLLFLISAAAFLVDVGRVRENQNTKQGNILLTDGILSYFLHHLMERARKSGLTKRMI
jgi:hypothetical protein